MPLNIKSKKVRLRTGCKFEKLANILIVLYICSINIWSDGSDTVIYSTLLCFAAMAAMLVAILPGRNIVVPRPLVYIVLFDAFCLLSVLWAADPSRSWTMATRTLPLLALFSIILYNYIDATGGKRLLLNSVYIAGVLLALYTVYMQGGIGGFLALLGSGVRVGGNVNNVNTIGLGTGMAAIIAFYYTVFERRFLHVVPFVVSVLVAFGTGSNKALVVIVLGCLLVLMFQAYVKGDPLAFVKAVGLIAALFAAIVMVLQLPMFETISTRFEQTVNSFLGDGGETDHSADVRLELYGAGFEQFLRTPFIGIGINNGALVAIEAVGYDYYLHNNYIELLVGCGIVGTALFYAAVGSSALRLIKGVRSTDRWGVLVLILILAWLIVQYGFVCYYSKTTYVYIVLAAVYAWPYAAPLVRRERKTHVFQTKDSNKRV